MASVIVDGIKAILLNSLTVAGGIPLLGCKYHLYTNNVTPAHGDVIGTYTEAAWAGYVAQTAGTWPYPTLDGTNHASTSGPALVFNNTSGSAQQVYGYFVTVQGLGNLICAERFAGAPLSIPSGQGLTLNPNITLTSEF